jgi:hypothetical protein
MWGRVDNIFGLLITVMAQIAIIAVLPWPYKTANLILCSLLFYLFLKNNLPALLLLSFWSAILVEIFTTAPFGFYTLALFLSLLFAYWLFNAVFTNRTLPAIVALGVFTTLIFRLLFWLENLLVSLKFETNFSLAPKEYWLTVTWELLFNTLILVILFLLAKRFIKKMKGVFLVKN